MNTTVYLIRHGHVNFPRDDMGRELIYGPDAVLSPKGEQQMKELCEGLKNRGVRLERIYTSPLPRAHRSAEILGEEFSFHVPIVDVEGLRAKLYPSLEGKPVKELEKIDGEIFFVSGPGDETPEDASERFWSAYQGIVGKNRGRTFAIVSHGEEIAALMHMLSVHTEIPENGEGFRLTVSPEGEILDYEKVRGEISARGVEMR